LSIHSWEKDADEGDNSAAVKVNIYFAHNGNRAYSWIDDTYRFENYGFYGRETEEMVEGLLATVAGNMQSDSSLLPAMQRLLFPATYTRFWNYAKRAWKWVQGTAAGHVCHILSLLHGPGKSQSPLPDEPGGQHNIAIYCRRRCCLWNAMMNDFRWQAR
jgi:hypothetical protein